MHYMEEKKLGKFDAFMLIICGIMFADTIASNSSTGVTSMSWWVILGALYMIPSGFIIGELSGAYPGEGGIYDWILNGLGPRWAARTSWLFFCCGLFIPVSSFIMCSDILFTLFAPSAGMTIRVIVAIIFIWVFAFVSTRPMSEAQGLTNAAGLVKLALFVGVFTMGIVYLAKGGVIANDMSAAALAPQPSDTLMYLPVILYCCTGMELASASAESFDNPAKVLPKVIVGSAVLAVVLNIIACWGMLTIIPLDSIDLDLGLLDVFKIATGSDVVYTIVGLLFVFGVFVQCVTWQVGGNRGTCESAKSGELPAILSREHNGQPIGAILICCILGTVLLILYAIFADSASDLFFSLLSCGVIGSLLPYVFMLIAYQRLKKNGGFDHYDGFKAPAGVAFSWICQILQVVTLFLCFYIPGAGWNDAVVTNTLGALIMIVSGEIAIRWAAKHPAPELAEEKAE